MDDKTRTQEQIIKAIAVAIAYMSIAGDPGSGQVFGNAIAELLASLYGKEEAGILLAQLVDATAAVINESYGPDACSPEFVEETKDMIKSTQKVDMDLGDLSHLVIPGDGKVH